MRDGLKVMLVLLACTMLVIGCGNDKDKDEDAKRRAQKPPKKAPTTQPVVTPPDKPPDKPPVKPPDKPPVKPPDKPPVKPPDKPPVKPPDKPPVTPTADEAQAKAVVVAVLTAMGKGDAEAGLKHLEAPAAVKEFMAKALAPMVQISSFMRAGEKAYGAKAWKAALAAAELGRLSDSVIPDAAEAAKTLKVETKDGKTTATWEGNDEPWNLAKKDGVWKVVLAAGDAPPKEQQAKVLTQFKAMGAAAAGVQGKIGQPGVTAKQVAEALLKELQKAFGEGGP